jgi:dihydrofolate reductase
MGSISVHEFIALDGVFENPTWTFDYHPWDPRMEKTVTNMTEPCTAILLGRTTFEAFAPSWSPRTVEDDQLAPFFNNTRKYVVGSQPPKEEWANTTHLGPYDPAIIRKLKNETDGGIYISGSGKLVRALLAEGLVDQLHLFVFPVARGSGERLWSRDVDPTKLTLKEHDVYNNGVVHLNYGPA